LTKDQLKPEFLCAVCQAILVEPVECRECKERYHHKCLEKFHSQTGVCPMGCKKGKYYSVKKEVEKKLNKMQFKCRNYMMGCGKVLNYLQVTDHDIQCEF
jgi:hypothetical protein